MAVVVPLTSEHIKECMRNLMNQLELIDTSCASDLCFLQSYIDKHPKKDPMIYSAIKDQIISYYAKKTSECETEICTYDKHLEIVLSLDVEPVDYDIPKLTLTHSLGYFMNHISISDLPSQRANTGSLEEVLPIHIHKNLTDTFIDMLSDAIDPEKIIKIMVEIDCYLEIFNGEGVCDPVHGYYYRYIVSLVPYDEYRTRRSNIIDSSELYTVAILRDYWSCLS
jgi:hypothetical protein